MRRFLLVLLGLVVVLVGGVLAAPHVVPRDTLKGWAGDAVAAATGRKLTIGGDFALRLVPALSLRAEDVRLANAPWGEAPDLATVGRLDVAVRLWPLVRGALVVDRLIVERPVVRLEVDRRGTSNWTFGDGTAPAADAPPAEGGSNGLPFDRVSLGEARLTDGLVTYRDARSGAAERVENIRLTAALDDLARPFRIDGGLSYRARPVVLTAAIDRPGAVLEGGESPARLNLTAPAARVAFAGVARPGGGSPRLDGRLDASVRPIRELTNWLKIPLDGVRPNALREASLKANVVATPASLTLAGLDLGLDAIRGRGELTAGLAGRPRLAGRIAFGALDLNPYLPPAEAARSALGTPPAGRPAGEAAAGWPDDPLPIDLAAAPPADADLTLTFASLTVDRAKLGAGRVALKADAGGSAAAIEGLRAHGGRVDARASARGGGAAPTVRAVLDARNVAVFPLLAAFADFERLEGKGDVTADLTGRGLSVKRIIGGLDGRGRVDLRDGAIRGVDLAGLMRSVGSLGLRRRQGPRPATDFSRLGAGFTVRRGLLDNRDLALQSPLIRVGGAGRVNLPARTLDYRVEPRLVASLEGQGGRDVAGLAVPIVVRGPWASPSYRLDLGGALSGDLRDPEALTAALRGALADPGRLPKGLRDRLEALGGRGGAEKAVRDLLGGRRGGEAEAVGRLLDRALGGGGDAGRNGAAARPSNGGADDPVGDLMNRALGGFGR